VAFLRGRRLSGERIDGVEGTGGELRVLIEDVHRMFERGATTSEYFLNVLDGLLQPSVPVRWLATSNEPTGIAPVPYGLSSGMG
jgi:hypothetical protein